MQILYRSIGTVKGHVACGNREVGAGQSDDGGWHSQPKVPVRLGWLSGSQYSGGPAHSAQTPVCRPRRTRSRGSEDPEPPSSEKPVQARYVVPA